MTERFEQALHPRRGPRLYAHDHALGLVTPAGLDAVPEFGVELVLGSRASCRLRDKGTAGTDQREAHGHRDGRAPKRKRVRFRETQWESWGAASPRGYANVPRRSDMGEPCQLSKTRAVRRRGGIAASGSDGGVNREPGKTCLRRDGAEQATAGRLQPALRLQLMVVARTSGGCSTLRHARPNQHMKPWRRCRLGFGCEGRKSVNSQLPTANSRFGQGESHSLGGDNRKLERVGVGIGVAYASFSPVRIRSCRAPAARTRGRRRSRRCAQPR